MGRVPHLAFESSYLALGSIAKNCLCYYFKSYISILQKRNLEQPGVKFFHRHTRSLFRFIFAAVNIYSRSSHSSVGIGMGYGLGGRGSIPGEG
jgi:hypothetical protein